MRKTLDQFAEEIGRYVPVKALNGSVTAIVDTATGDIDDTYSGKNLPWGRKFVKDTLNLTP